jgi:hypothetical protein
LTSSASAKESRFIIIRARNKYQTTNNEKRKTIKTSNEQNITQLGTSNTEDRSWAVVGVVGVVVESYGSAGCCCCVWLGLFDFFSLSFLSYLLFFKPLVLLDCFVLIFFDCVCQTLKLKIIEDINEIGKSKPKSVEA